MFLTENLSTLTVHKCLNNYIDKNIHGKTYSKLPLLFNFGQGKGHFVSKIYLLIFRRPLYWISRLLSMFSKLEFTYALVMNAVGVGTGSGYWTR